MECFYTLFNSEEVKTISTQSLPFLVTVGHFFPVNYKTKSRSADADFITHSLLEFIIHGDVGRRGRPELRLSPSSLILLS